MDLQLLLKAGISHSCYPNSAYTYNNELVAVKVIEPGTGITVDFSTLSLGGELIMRCTCGYVGCRKLIMGFDMLPVIVQEKYIKSDMVPHFILKSIKKDLMDNNHVERKTS